MKAHTELLLGLTAALVTASCGGYNSAGGTTPPSKATLSATPAAFTFILDQNAPQRVDIMRSTGAFTSLQIVIGDPSVAGVTTPSLNGASATFSVIPIAHGSTSVQVTDQTGATTGLNVTTASCGRPASLLAAQQLVPSPDAKHIPTSIGTIYLLAYFQNGSTLSGSLHLIVGQHGSLEGGPLVAATAPPGTVLPTPIPIPNSTQIVVSATVPTLTTAQQYETQVYNDTCQPAVLSGTFTT